LAKLKTMGHKRLFFDIENSYMIVKGVWFLGEQRILPQNVIQYGRIICISYKWEGSDKIHRIHWDKGCDKQMMKKFFDVVSSADEVVTHNGDNHDIKWIQTRFLTAGFKSMPPLKSLDTLKMARKFKFPSNKLDEIARYLDKEAGFKIGRKLKHSGLEMWDEVILNNSRKELKNMQDYCDQDVFLLEKIYKFLEGFSKHKTHIGIQAGEDSCSCPQCGSDRTGLNNRTIGVNGQVKCIMKCHDCSKYFSISLRSFNNR